MSFFYDLYLYIICKHEKCITQPVGFSTTPSSRFGKFIMLILSTSLVSKKQKKSFIINLMTSIIKYSLVPTKIVTFDQTHGFEKLFGCVSNVSSVKQNIRILIYLEYHKLVTMKQAKLLKPRKCWSLHDPIQKNVLPF